MNRRILPIMLRPTSMAEKARELHLWGRQKLDKYVEAHAREFAAYFYAIFHANEYAFLETDYDYEDYNKDILDSQADLTAEQTKDRQALDILKAEGLLKFVDGLARQFHVALDPLKSDIIQVTGGKAEGKLNEHMKLDNGTLYIDSSKSFLLRYGSNAAKIRTAFKEFYGEPVKKFHKRMFAIPFAIGIPGNRS